MVNLLDLNDDPIAGSGNVGKNSSDGILRIDPKKGKDGKYTMKVRFLPNIRKDGTAGLSIVEKHVHYIKIPNMSEYDGYFDCQNTKGVWDKCKLCDLWNKLNKSKDVSEQDKKEYIKRSPKYYSYVYVLEDENNPENVGKIMILPYGFKIWAKIEAESKGENAKEEKCNIFNLANGKDFRLTCELVGGFNNYDSSMFLDNSPLKIRDEEGKFKAIPTYENSEGKKVFGFEDENKQAKVNAKIANFLMGHESSIEDLSIKEWSEDQNNKVINIWAYLTGAKTKVKSNPFESEDDPFVKDDKKVETKSSASTSEDDSDDGWGF